MSSEPLEQHDQNGNDSRGSTTLSQAAIMYAEHGVAIFPVRPNAKQPALPRCPDTITEDGHKLTGNDLAEHAADCPNDGHGFHDATTDIDTIRRWWTDIPDANIGIALGANGIFAVDVDGPAGRKTLDDLEATYQPLPDTYEVITGRPEGHGRHHIYWQPSDGPTVGNSRIGTDLETRGDGGYIIAPPSIHESGRPYLAEGSWSQITDPPGWLIALATKPTTPTTPTPGPLTGDELANKRLTAMAGRVAIAPEGDRNNQLNWAAYTAGRLVGAGRLDRTDVELTLTVAAQRAGLDPHETAATIASGIDGGISDPDHDQPTSNRTPAVTTLHTFNQDTPDPTPDGILQAALDRVENGAQFILDTDHSITPLWGNDTEVLWASGEPFIITGPTGVGKTTVAHQILERRIGINTDPLFGLPVPTDDRPVLYLAADRPAQIRRAFARRFTETHRQPLTDRLLVHNGYLPVMVDQHPELLHQLVEQLGAGTLVIDSLKDVATELEKGPAAQAINASLQRVCQAGCDVIVLHHQRKAQSDNRRPKAIDDLYGNTLIPAGSGSVALIWGTPGAYAVELHHLKQPADEVGPLKLMHDHHDGTTRIDEEHQITVLKIVQRADKGMTARQVACELFATTKPGRNQKEKARRDLDDAVDQGALRVKEGGPHGAHIYLPNVPPTTLLEG